MSLKFYVLGVDQGIANCGCAIVEFEEDAKGELTYKVIEHACLKTTSAFYMGTRLNKISEKIATYFSLYDLSIVGCEKLFFSPPRKNEKKFRNKSASMLYTSYATGMLYILTSTFGVQLKDFTPGTVKKIICENGKATKEDMISKIKDDFSISTNLSEHEADAIGIAVAAGLFYYKDQKNCNLINKAIKAHKKIK